MADERAETLAREQAVRETLATPVEIGGTPQVAAAATEPAVVAPEVTQSDTGETTPMIPKFRYDELNSKYQAIRNQPKSTEVTPDLDRLVEAKLAPLRVQMETDRVLKSYEDFPSFADEALRQIEKNPTLSLEDGYILAKAKSGVLASNAKEQGKNEAYNNIQRKETATGTSSGRKAEPKSVDELIRDPSVSLKDIERMLPKS